MTRMKRRILIPIEPKAVSPLVSELKRAMNKSMGEVLDSHGPYWTLELEHHESPPMGDETKGGFFEFGTRNQSQILTFFEEIIDGLHRMNDNIDCEHVAQGIVLQYPIGRWPNGADSGFNWNCSEITQECPIIKVLFKNIKEGNKDDFFLLRPLPHPFP